MFGSYNSDYEPIMGRHDLKENLIIKNGKTFAEVCANNDIVHHIMIGGSLFHVVTQSDIGFL